jgi:integrase
MERVQPIRSLKDLAAMKDYLRNRNYRDYIMFRIGCNTALRVSDLLALTVGQARNLDYITGHAEKTGRAFRLLLTKTLKKEIADYTKGMKDDDPMFPSRIGGKAITPVQAWRILNSAAKALGLPDVGTHTMRKTFGYHFYRKTKDIALVQYVLGHSSPSNTRYYIGITDDEVERAMEWFEL